MDPQVIVACESYDHPAALLGKPILRIHTCDSACFHTCPAETYGYQLSPIITSLSLSPICWHVLTCGSVFMNALAHTIKYKDTLKPWRMSLQNLTQ